MPPLRCIPSSECPRLTMQPTSVPHSGHCFWSALSYDPLCAVPKSLQRLPVPPRPAKGVVGQQARPQHSGYQPPLESTEELWRFGSDHAYDGNCSNFAR